jgi:hypothetical protein
MSALGTSDLEVGTSDLEGRTSDLEGRTSDWTQNRPISGPIWRVGWTVDGWDHRDARPTGPRGRSLGIPVCVLSGWPTPLGSGPPTLGGSHLTPNLTHFGGRTSDLEVGTSDLEGRTSDLEGRTSDLEGRTSGWTPNWGVLDPFWTPIWRVRPDPARPCLGQACYTGRNR